MLYVVFLIAAAAAIFFELTGSKFDWQDYQSLKEREHSLSEREKSTLASMREIAAIGKAACVVVIIVIFLLFCGIFFVR